MEPIRKQFHSDATFPFDIVYKDTKQSIDELPHHLHEWCELIYVYSGTGNFFIDQTLYDMHAGDLFIIPEDTIHRAFPDAANPVTSTAIFFNPVFVRPSLIGDPFSYLHAFEQSKKRKSYKFACPPSFQTQLEQHLEQICEEMLTKRSSYRQAIVLHLQYILFGLIRETEPEHQPELTGSHYGPLWMQETLRDIDMRLFEDIGLAVLAKQAAVSAAHFSRVFKQLTGMNVTHYITTKRIIHAKELLRVSDSSVSSIAMCCGFESLPHFYRVFKKITGATPTEYKKQQE
ncbi:AraC family transcriptional regulator [Paenibacillus monticola]|uniref:Helix-turn-helix domain-containing protein n=1 Tax=Paenibacillus monticola TaxID=2666075 RepID=A0A7X2HAC7_9BACL|nr:AraC family transcriptional regulator [Paenibacillus monticola]MRN56462.1 helix-turn-helix domain-containing protein [Paenibacillus monticola]